MSKKSLKLSIEEGLLNEAKKHIPNLSGFFENCLTVYLGYGEEPIFTTLQAEKELEKIKEAQLNLLLLAKTDFINDKQKEEEIKEIDKKWRILVNEYMDTLTYDDDAIDELSKLTDVPSKTIQDLLDYCFMNQENSFNEFYATKEVMKNEK